MGSYLVLLKESCGSSEEGTCDAASPLGAAYALLALAVAACLWDLYRRGPVFPSGGLDAGSTGLPPAGGVDRGGNRCAENAESTLSPFGEAWLRGHAAGGAKGGRHDADAILAEAPLLVPAHNEAEGVESLVREIKRMYPEVDILVLDDGSRDGTSGKAYAAGAAILRSSRNRGIGEMMRGGLSFMPSAGAIASRRVSMETASTRRIASPPCWGPSRAVRRR